MISKNVLHFISLLSLLVIAVIIITMSTTRWCFGPFSVKIHSLLLPVWILSTWFFPQCKDMNIRLTEKELVHRCECGCGCFFFFLSLFSPTTNWRLVMGIGVDCSPSASTSAGEAAIENNGWMDGSMDNFTINPKLLCNHQNLCQIFTEMLNTQNTTILHWVDMSDREKCTCAKCYAGRKRNF